MGNRCSTHIVGDLLILLPRIVRLTFMLRDFLPDGHKGFDVVIMSDLVHFDSFHDILLDSATSLLSKSPTARLHVAVSC